MTMKKWYAVLGDPIEQSMSPFMHGRWFEENQIDASYIPIHVTSEKLKDAVESLRTLGCSGWNVTVPHKQTIIPFLDELEESARVMDAVNTVVRTDDGRLIGANTDGLGFVKSLEELFGQRAKEGAVLMIGAGGAARGIAFAMESSGFGPIFITNRTLEKAAVLAGEIKGATALALHEAEERLGEFSVLVQTTSVGMNYAKAGIPIGLSQLTPGSIVADIIYNPLKTELLKTAEESGADILNGVGMFVHQGALAFQKWTGKYPDTEKMNETITMKVGG